MVTRLKIDFVSDVSCPWCAVGLGSLQVALSRLSDGVSADVHFQPFELNPDLEPEGEDAIEHLMRKYGTSPEHLAQNSELIRARGEAVGFIFDMAKRERIYNTFDAHRLLHWAGLEGRQAQLKKALFEAYFTHGQNPSDHEVLIKLAEEAGLDADKARQILASSAYEVEVRERERFYRDRGINSVPAIIVNNRHLIQGGQPPEVFEQALRQIADAASEG